MKYLFIIVDCSGSMLRGGTSRVGRLNDLLGDAFTELASTPNLQYGLVRYSDSASFHLPLSDSLRFRDFDTTNFSGRSNLGKAYGLIADCVADNSLPLGSCLLALVCDGAATDDYARALSRLDPDGVSARLGLAVGGGKVTLLAHCKGDVGSLYEDPEDFLDHILRWAQ